MIRPFNRGDAGRRPGGRRSAGWLWLLRHLFSRVRDRLKRGPGQSTLDDDLREEIEYHIGMRTRLNQESGMLQDEAREMARRQFGNRILVQEDARHMHVNLYLEAIAQDLRYSLRSFLRNPAFTLTAILAVALGIGATTAVFSVVDRVLFRALPYPDDDRLVSVGILAPAMDSNEFLMADAYLEWRAHQTPFASITSWSFITDCDLTEQNPVRLRCAKVEASFLPTFGIQPLAGRNFTRDEDRPNALRVALITYGFWQRRFGGGLAVVNQSISLDGQPTIIVGILPRGFELPNLEDADLLIPQALNEGVEHSGRALRAFARLNPGVAISQAFKQMEPLFQIAVKQAPPEFRTELKLVVRSLRDRQIHDVRLASWILFGAVISVLLIACANVANLLLARAASRRREVAVRAALGASRSRLIRQTLTESVLLALLGGLAGCGLAWAVLRLFVAIAPDGVVRLEQANLDLRVLMFTAAVCVTSGILCGLAPAIANPRPEALSGGRTIGLSRGIFRQSLVAAQIAVCVVLLTASGMLLRSLWNLENVRLGIKAESVITARFVLGRRYLEGSRQLSFFNALEDRLHRLPGGTSVAISDSIPPSGGTRGRPYFAISVESRPQAEEGTGGLVVWRYVTAGYFEALGIPVVRGRAFREEDGRPNEYAIVLSESLARRLFPNEEPLGKHILKTDRGHWFTVIGIAADVKNAGPRIRSDPEYYVMRKHVADETFANQDPSYGWRGATIIIRTRMDPRAVSRWLRSALASLDATLPVTVETMQQHISRLSQRSRFIAILLSIFAGMGVLLAAIGLYGVVAFLTVQRTQEIGVRVALGATPANITRMLLAQAARWSGSGAVAGLAGSLFASRVLRSLLFQVPEKDPWTLLSAAGLLLLIAFTAAWLPSKLAAARDPVRALRQE